MVTKLCSRCRFERPLDQYRKDTSRRDGLQRYCKGCQKEKAQEYQADGRRGRTKRAASIRKYGITVERYEEILASQDGVCAICREECSSGWALCIDHDHACCPSPRSGCGKCVRGLLCRRCNTGIGHFQDNADLVSRALEYLTTH